MYKENHVTGSNVRCRGFLVVMLPISNLGLAGVYRRLGLLSLNSSQLQFRCWAACLVGAVYQDRVEVEFSCRSDGDRVVARAYG